VKPTSVASRLYTDMLRRSNAALWRFFRDNVCILKSTR
jgi:hypothetical protein